MNADADQIYTNYQTELNSSLVIPTTANRIIHHQSSNGDNGTLSTTDYINSNIVNYLPNLPIINNADLHHQTHQFIKSRENGFMETKEPHMIHIYHGDGSSNIIQSADLPVLTPLKYMDEYHTNNLSNIVSAGTDEQMLSNNEDVMSEKSDCEYSENNELNKLPMKHVKRNLPHKKRIAKKLHSDEFSIILSADDSTMRSSLQTTTPHFECAECGLTFIGQLEFFIHLKIHYEGAQPEKRKRHVQTEELEIHHEDDANSVPENLIIESGDAFNFSEPEDMEDFRKEVEKVVETIGDTECLPDESWGYQVTDEIEQNSENVEMIQNFNEKIDNSAMDQSAFSNQQCDTYLCQQEIIKEEDNHSEKHQSIMQQYTSNSNQMSVNNDPGSDEEEDDNKPLEQVRLMLKSKTKKNPKQKAPSNDEEFNECLKKIQNFKCNDCNKFFNSRTALGYHLKTHSSERRYVCDQCGKKFLTNGALKVHLRLHTNDRPYKCEHPDCGKSFRQWGDLKYHQTSLHSDKKDHVCEFCAKAFARKYSLVIHRRIHTGEKTYKCTECEKSFRASSYLLNHKRIHSGERPFACGTCGKKFRVQGDLKRHTKIHERVKNGVSKEKKKQIDPKLVSVNENVVMKTEYSVKEEKMESSESKIKEFAINDAIEPTEVSKKVKKSHKKKSLK